MGDVLDALEADHRRVERLLDELAASEEGPERERLVATLDAALALHMRFEEEQIYPLLQQVDPEMREEAQTEHTLGREGLAKLRELASAPGFGAAVDMLKGGITHHVSEEESEAFPGIRESADSSALAELTTLLMAQKREAGVLEAELEMATREELLEQAKEADIQGRSSMTKDELREALTSGG